MLIIIFFCFMKEKRRRNLSEGKDLWKGGRRTDSGNQIKDRAVAVFAWRPEKWEATPDPVNVFVSKAAPVETRVILSDPTLSSRTYLVSFQPWPDCGCYFIRDILPPLEYSVAIFSSPCINANYIHIKWYVLWERMDLHSDMMYVN